MKCSTGLTLVALIALAACRDDTVVDPKLPAAARGPARDLGIASGLVAVDLGTLGGVASSEAKAINDSRQIIGVEAPRATWLWQNGTMTDLGNSGLGFALDISDNGAIVGQVLGGLDAALLNGSTLTVLGTLGGAQSIAFGVNDALQVIGWSETPQPPEHGFVWQNGTMSDLGGLTANHWTRAYGINSSGQIVGTSAEVYYCNDSGCGLSQTHPFVCQNGVMSKLDVYRGTAYAINDAGVVAGEAADSAVFYLEATIWQNGVRTRLGVLPGDSESRATAINSAGRVVGISSVGQIGGGGGERAFLWQNGVMTELPSLGGAYSNALGINDDGDIVGWSNTASGERHAVLWTDTPPNRPPTASAGGPYAGVEGTAIGFDASGSSDPDGQSLTYDWDFGDGSPHGSGPTPQHTYVDNGTYLVSLTVSDGALSAAASTNATVANAAPVPNAGVDKTIVVNRSTPFIPSFADAGSADANWTYTVRWGDGTSITRTATSQGAQPSLSRTYNTAGTYTRRLTVTDKDGGTAFDEATITVVPNQPPNVSINGPYIGNEGTAVAFSSAGTNDPNGDQLTYTWRFGDGATSAAANPSRVYSDNGTYTVTLTARDPSGATATATTTATIANVSPTAAFVAPATVTEGTPATLALNAGTDKGAADRSTLEYAFDCGQGGGLSPWSSSIKSIVCPAHPDQRPPITVIGQIRDKDGGLTSYQRTMSVTNATPVATLTATTATTFPVGGALGVQGSFSDKGVNDQPWTYTLTWGDGTASTGGSVTAPGSLPAASHVYTRAGTFAVRLNVKDKDGKTGTSASIMVTVTP